jgi:murein DD-endopeptidase MepM/ murein hydrolase activator NlpD
VKSVTEDAWFNLSVVIDHGGGLQTVYRNLGAVRVKEGAELDREQVFAELGTPGSAEVGDGGPRLHFEVRRGELALDPLQFLR